jgi:hypothetical protein
VLALPRIDWRTVLKALAGFVAGLLLWVFLSPTYDGMISSVAARVMRAFERPPVTRLVLAKDNFVTVDRADFDPRSNKPAIPVRDLTFNFLLLTALFAASKRTFSDRNIGGFVVAVLLLALTHVFGTIAEVMSIYVGKLGQWSTVHYSDTARTFWQVTNHFYRLVLMYAIAFALWFVFRDKADAAPVKTAGPKKKKRR